MKGQIDYVVFTVVEIEGQDKSRWKELGVGFRNKDSITILLDAVPLNGKLILTKPKPKEDKQDNLNFPG